MVGPFIRVVNYDQLMTILRVGIATEERENRDENTMLLRFYWEF